MRLFCPSAMHRSGRAVYCGLALLSLAGSGGCVRATVVDDTTIFTNELWVPLLMLIGGMASVWIGWGLRGASDWFAWGLMISGLIAMVIFAPSVWMDRTTVNDDSFTFRVGLFGANQTEAKFDDIRKVHLTTKQGRRGRVMEYLTFDQKNGDSFRYSLSIHVVKAASEPIVQRCRARGIPCDL